MSSPTSTQAMVGRETPEVREDSHCVSPRAMRLLRIRSPSSLRAVIVFTVGRGLVGFGEVLTEPDEREQPHDVVRVQQRIEELRVAAIVDDGVDALHEHGLVVGEVLVIVGPGLGS